MMDVQKLREEFEKLPEIARRLKSSNTIKYIESDNSYSSPEWDSLTCCNEDFINPAWYAFQEQQKKIEEIKAMAENWINQDYTYNSDSTDIKIQQMKDCGRDIIQKINGE